MPLGENMPMRRLTGVPPLSIEKFTPESETQARINDRAVAAIPDDSSCFFCYLQFFYKTPGWRILCGKRESIFILVVPKLQSLNPNSSFDSKFQTESETKA